MAASSVIVSARCARTIYSIKPSKGSLNAHLLPSINRSWDSVRGKTGSFTAGGHIHKYHYCWNSGCTRVDKWTGHWYNLNLTRCYASAQSSDSTWAIVRLIQKAGSLSEKILYKISPKLHGFYRQFIDGGKVFIKDVRFVYRLRGRMKQENLTLTDLPWKDIYIKDKVTRDMGKVIPTMIVTWLPFAFYVMLPLIFTFPRQFLSDHFLNKEQLSDFQHKSLKSKHLEEEKLWKHIKDQEVRQPPFVSNKENSLPLSGKNPYIDIEEALRLRPLFKTQLRLQDLPRTHLVSLCKLHSLLTFMLPSSLLCQRLAAKCSVLQAMDLALRRDSIENIQDDDLRKLCYQRVFESSNTPVPVMRDCVKSWLEITSALEDYEHSLYLHLPLFKKEKTSC